MKIPRCRALSWYTAAGLIALSPAISPATAQAQNAVNYPTKPVRFVCVTAPGGGLDVIGRIVAERLSRSLGQSVIMENRPGAGGNIASEYVARGNNDGYTLLETTVNHHINSFIYKHPGYSHITWIGLLAPTGTPRDIILRLNKDIAAILVNPEVQSRIVAIGAQPVGKSPAAFEAMLKTDYEATAKLVAQIGLKVD